MDFLQAQETLTKKFFYISNSLNYLLEKVTVIKENNTIN